MVIFHFFQFFFFFLGTSAASSEATKTKPKIGLDGEVTSNSGASAPVFGFQLHFRLESAHEPKLKLNSNLYMANIVLFYSLLIQVEIKKKYY